MPSKNRLYTIGKMSFERCGCPLKGLGEQLLDCFIHATPLSRSCEHLLTIGGQISIQISNRKSQIFKLPISNLAKQIPMLNPTSNQIPQAKIPNLIINLVLFSTQNSSNEKGKHLITLSCKFHGIKILHWLQPAGISVCAAAVTPLLLQTGCCVSHEWWHQQY